MSAPEEPRLAPGLTVRPWRHFFGPFDLGARVSLYPGGRVKGSGVDPRRPPRPPDASELALLDGAASPQGPALELFTTPALLREHFEALDPDELPAPGGCTPSKGWSAFGADVAAFLAHVEAPLARPYALLLDVRDPDHAPSLLAAGACRTLLTRVGGPGSSEGQAPAWAAHVNLGEVPSALVFWNVALPAMAMRLEAERRPAPPDAPSLVASFTEHFPACPLVRLTLAPGEGVFVPFPLVAHDIDAAGAEDLVVTLTALPGA